MPCCKVFLIIVTETNVNLTVTKQKVKGNGIKTRFSKQYTLQPRLFGELHNAVRSNRPSFTSVPWAFWEWSCWKWNRALCKFYLIAPYLNLNSCLHLSGCNTQSCELVLHHHFLFCIWESTRFFIWWMRFTVCLEKIALLQCIY